MIQFILLLPIFIACGIAQPVEDYYWPKNVITVPPNCPPGQQWVNGECRDIWRFFEVMEHVPEDEENDDDLEPNNMIIVPNNCRPGQQWVNGQCRDIWRQNGVMPSNTITVPPNCPKGQEYVNGECREIWRSPSVLLEKLMVSDLDVPKEQKQIDEEMSVDAVDLLGEPLNKNIINIPNHCPVGFKPDALGFCRPIFGEVV
ncbi:uncharacterized protein LOC115454468 [Manduca sexta]|uniref:Uncharacterized protein n=1 Tax=Manduca sexta TaxID=7130 RepID=A0A921YNF6_MANSE|nr:uncharacterized protein LOC115454468 [Manduca sexta]KAG6442616.1 hypothetical protein O3G_MSEX002480 [Manduca sexta]